MFSNHVLFGEWPVADKTTHMATPLACEKAGKGSGPVCCL